FGPGRAHLYELLRHAIACGFRHFDFTVGDEPYKRDWCDGELRLYDHLAAGSLRGAIVLAMPLAFRRTKRFIKQTQMWWPVFSNARALAGLLRWARFRRSERDDFCLNRHPALAFWWSMIFFRKPVPTFRDHALATFEHPGPLPSLLRRAAGFLRASGAVSGATP